MGYPPSIVNNVGSYRFVTVISVTNICSASKTVVLNTSKRYTVHFSRMVDFNPQRAPLPGVGLAFSTG